MQAESASDRHSRGKVPKLEGMRKAVIVGWRSRSGGVGRETGEISGVQITQGLGATIRICKCIIKAVRSFQAEG